jgi:glycosyltransferase involved in cell wall biosynthesis
MRGIRERQLSGQVLVMGRLPHAQVPAYLRSGRIGVVPLQPIAKFLSNIPTKLFEYWACGLPVVVGTLPPILPFVRDGNNGLLFPPTSSVELAAQLSWLLDHPEAAQRMGTAGQAQVAKAWNNETQVVQLLGLYERLLHTKPSQMSPAGKRRDDRLVPQ